MTTLERLARLCTSERAAGYIFAAACLVTVGILAVPGGGSAITPPPNDPPRLPAAPTDGLKIAGSLSQTKIVKGSDGIVYFEVNVDPPAAAASTQPKRKPVDMVVVLDHSGSMAAENRLTYAKAAISDLLARLTAEDRFGLITFETNARIVTPLSFVTPTFRTSQQERVTSIDPAGSTNLSGGLEMGIGLLDSISEGRTRKVVLLSDGEANVGTVEPTQLAAIARRASSGGKIVSTIGMGLDFNETLMASLADNGMGNYAYLENLAGLDNILSKDLESSRAVYASASGLEIRLPEGAKLIDSSGFPQEPAGGNAVRVLTGQLIAGIRKSIFLTVQAPTDKLGTFSFGEVTFNYTADGKASQVPLQNTELAFHVVPESQEAEALASVRESIFKKGWAVNRLGRMQEEYSRQMKAGNVPAALMAVDSYRDQAAKAESKYRVKVLEGSTAAALADMGANAAQVQSAPPVEQELLQKRAAKQFYSESQANSRAN